MRFAIEVVIFLYLYVTVHLSLWLVFQDRREIFGYGTWGNGISVWAIIPIAMMWPYMILISLLNRDRKKR